MSNPIVIHIPGLRTVTQPRIGEHPRVKVGRKIQENDATFTALWEGYRAGRHIDGRPTVRFVRLGPNTALADSDNLRASFKYIRDTVAKYFHRDDKDALWDWQYAQERTKEYGVRIEIEVPDEAK